jgi:hypothetical protein
MAKQNPREPRLTVDRRQLLTTAAAVTVTGIVPHERTKAATPAEPAINAIRPAPPPQRVNVCARNAQRIEEIVARNRIRQEAGLPPLSIPKELRRMKTADDLAAFERFAAAHRQAVWDEILAPVREAKADPYWRPMEMMEGLGYQARISDILRERFISQQHETDTAIYGCRPGGPPLLLMG